MVLVVVVVIGDGVDVDGVVVDVVIVVGAEHFRKYHHKISKLALKPLTCCGDSQIAAGYSQEASPSYDAVRPEGDHHVAAAGDGGGQC